MSTREKVLHKIQNTKDDNLLEEVLKMIDIQAELDEVTELSLEEENAIEEGLSDVMEGRIYEDKDVKEFFQQWLQKK